MRMTLGPERRFTNMSGSWVSTFISSMSSEQRVLNACVRGPC